jgi:mannose-1-phosphate guanylyltransferase
MSEVKKIAMILAGGLGTKFWPKSTEKFPKQFTHTVGDGTMVQNTFNRLKQYFALEDIYIVTSYAHRDLAQRQIPELPSLNFIFEPFGRNTAPAVALASNYILRNGASQDSLFAIFPSDHIISNLGEFYNSLDKAFDAAESEKAIITIGIQPTRPETQFGYIQIQNDKESEESIKSCMTFAEKPDIGTATRFIESGDFLWNSGIFVWKLSTFYDALNEFLPDYAEQFKNLDNYFGDLTYVEELKYLYKQINSISLDYGILEKAPNVLCILSTFTWSDLGNWDELYRLQHKDAHDNVIHGDVVSIENKHCLVESNGKMIALVGIEDAIIIDTDEALLICKRGESERVQEVVDFLRRKHIHRLL